MRNYYTSRWVRIKSHNKKKGKSTLKTEDDTNTPEERNNIPLHLLLVAVTTSLLPIIASTLLTVLAFTWFGMLISILILLVLLLPSIVLGNGIFHDLQKSHEPHSEHIPRKSNEDEDESKEVRQRLANWSLKPSTTISLGLSGFIIILALLFLFAAVLGSGSVAGSTACYTVATILSVVLVRFLLLPAIVRVDIAQVAVLLLLEKRVFRNMYLLGEGYHLILPSPLMGYIMIDTAEHTIEIPGPNDLIKVLVGTGSESGHSVQRAEIGLRISILHIIENPWSVLDTASEYGDEDISDGRAMERSVEAVIVKGLKDTVQSGAVRVASQTPSPLEFLKRIGKPNNTIINEIIDLDLLREQRYRWGIYFFSGMITEAVLADDATREEFNLGFRENLQRERDLTEADTLMTMARKLMGDSEMTLQDALLASQTQMGKMRRINHVFTGNRDPGDFTMGAAVGLEKEEGGKE
jgi:uncharacterized membrane protein YhaH (DUF805 family)